MFWPWEDCRMLLTFMPARMKSEVLHPVLLMYHPVTAPLPRVNNMGFRPLPLTRLKCWYCGPARTQASCPIGERLVGCCPHVSASLFCAAVLPNNINVFKTTYRGCHVIDRKSTQGIDRKTYNEIIN